VERPLEGLKGTLPCKKIDKKPAVQPTTAGRDTGGAMRHGNNATIRAIRLGTKCVTKKI